MSTNLRAVVRSTIEYFVLKMVHIKLMVHIQGWVGLEFIPKDDPETCHYNFGLPQRGWLTRFGIPKGIKWMGTWKTFHHRRILHAPGAISVHGGVSASEPRTRAFRSKDEWSSDLPTAGRFM